MQDALDQAFAAGRAAEREMAKIAATVRSSVIPPVQRATKAVDTPKAPKAPTIAHGANKAARPRVKGVKDAIVALIANNGLSVGEIVQRTGFKATSVRATLMGLKQAGRATNDENAHWSGRSPTDQTSHGNSESGLRV